MPGDAISRVHWWHYRIPFRAPFATAHGLLTHREGLLLRVETAEGRTGLGELAPPPGFGRSLTQAVRGLPTVVGRIAGASPADALATMRTAEQTPIPTALLCGIEAALLDLEGQATGRSLAALLAGHHALTIPVNATVGAAQPVPAAQQAAAALAAGFGAVKLKVGISTEITAEVERVAAVREVIGPSVQLRLDANEAWTAETAITCIRAFERYAPEWIEQPVVGNDVAALAAVRRAVRTPIAADEAVTGEAAVRRLLAAGAVDALVVKPPAIGGLATCRQLAALAAASDVRVIVTSSLESGVGIAAAAHLAATLPVPLRACGLATAAHLVSDLLATPLRIQAGQLHVPDGPGLGVQVDWERLAQYAIGAGEERAA